MEDVHYQKWVWPSIDTVDLLHSVSLSLGSRVPACPIRYNSDAATACMFGRRTWSRLNDTTQCPRQLRHVFILKLWHKFVYYQVRKCTRPSPLFRTASCKWRKAGRGTGNEATLVCIPTTLSFISVCPLGLQAFQVLHLHALTVSETLKFVWQ